MFKTAQCKEDPILMKVVYGLIGGVVALIGICCCGCLCCGLKVEQKTRSSGQGVGSTAVRSNTTGFHAVSHYDSGGCDGGGGNDDGGGGGGGDF